MITHISQLDPNGTYTYADYLQWRFAERYALVDIYESGAIPSRISPDLLVSHERVFQ